MMTTQSYPPAPYPCQQEFIRPVIRIQYGCCHLCGHCPTHNYGHKSVEQRSVPFDPTIVIPFLTILVAIAAFAALNQCTNDFHTRNCLIPAKFEIMRRKADWVIKDWGCGWTAGGSFTTCNEDFDFNSGEWESVDLMQVATKPSVQTARGHQGPAAYLMRVSRLDECGLDSAHPMKYTHLDIGYSMGAYPKASLPAPLLTLVADHILPKVKL